MQFLSFSKAIVFSVFSLCAMNSATWAKESYIEKTKSVQSAKVKSITMALGVKGEEAEPVNRTDVFKPTDTIHAVVKVVDAPADTNVSATWVAVDVGNAAEPNSEILTTNITTSGTRNVDFTLKPSQPFPVGSYQVEISINGTLDSTKKFTVKSSL